jgi:hypothetical protein
VRTFSTCLRAPAFAPLSVVIARYFTDTSHRKRDFPRSAAQWYDAERCGKFSPLQHPGAVAKW